MSLMTTRVMTTPRSVSPALGEDNTETACYPQPLSSITNQHDLFVQRKPVSGKNAVGNTGSCMSSISPFRTVSDDSLDSRNVDDSIHSMKTPNHTPFKMSRRHTSTSPLYAVHRLPCRGGASGFSTGTMYDERLSRLATATTVADSSKRKTQQQLQGQHNKENSALSTPIMIARVQCDDVKSQNLLSADFFTPAPMTPLFAVGTSGSHSKLLLRSPVNHNLRDGQNGTSRLPRICYRPKKDWCTTPTTVASRRRAFRRAALKDQKSNLKMRCSSDAIFRSSSRDQQVCFGEDRLDMPILPLLSPSGETQAPRTPARDQRSDARMAQFNNPMLSPFAILSRSVDHEHGEVGLDLEEITQEGLAMPVF